MCIDSGGHKTQAVYEYGRKRYLQKVYIIKGVGGENIPIVGAQSKVKCGKSKRTVKIFPVGVDQAKGTIYGRLRITTFGSGYMHFPRKCDSEYFDSLTAEKLQTKYSKGFAKRVWTKIRARNEALDCRVYSYAALKILNPNFERIGERLEENTIKNKLQLLKEKLANKDGQPVAENPDKPKENTTVKEHKRRKVRVNNNYAKSWRRG